MKDFDIPVHSLEEAVQDRSKLCGLINKGAAHCEAERKRRERKVKTNVPPADSFTLTCSICNRLFRARIGLVTKKELANTNENSIFEPPHGKNQQSA